EIPFLDPVETEAEIQTRAGIGASFRRSDRRGIKGGLVRKIRLRTDAQRGEAFPHIGEKAAVADAAAGLVGGPIEILNAQWRTGALAPGHRELDRARHGENRTSVAPALPPGIHVERR